MAASKDSVGPVNQDCPVSSRGLRPLRASAGLSTSTTFPTTRETYRSHSLPSLHGRHAFEPSQIMSVRGQRTSTKWVPQLVSINAVIYERFYALIKIYVCVYCRRRCPPYRRFCSSMINNSRARNTAEAEAVQVCN